MKHQLPETPWEGSGVPPWKREQLLYNGPSETLVAVMYRGFGTDEAPVRRLYRRRLPGTIYEPVDVRHKLETHEYAHCCEATPFLIFNEMRFEDRRPTPEYLKIVLKGKELPDAGWGSNWIGIRRVNLETGEDRRVTDELSLNLPQSYQRGWVSDILSISADGSTAICTVGLDKGGSVDYSVYEVSLTEGLKRKIADLPQVFL